MPNVKIVCTLGPASDDEATIRDLLGAGMAVARLNASHGTPEHRERVVERIRSAARDRPDPVAVMLDLPGPEVRTAATDEPVHLDVDSTVRFVEGESVTPERVGLSIGIEAVQPGDRVLLDDGRIETVVESVEGGVVEARVVSGGDLGSRRGVNVPGVDLGLPAVTERDRRELEIAADHPVDFVAASFVRDGADVYEVGRALEDLGADVPVVAKVERADAVENLEGIVEEAYGVMVARGDLGVECPMEEVPLAQKRIIRRCREAGVPVITATEMLDSMVHERRPTRAEASDVANAVLDGTDAVMLSGETAVGDHPVRVVEAMDRIVSEVEASAEYADASEGQVPGPGDTRTDALARSARFLATDVDASAVVVASESGYTARKAAKYRPEVPVLAATPDRRVQRQLALSWGAVPRSVPPTTEGVDAVIQNAVQAALDSGVADAGDTVVVLSGMMTGLEGMNATNMLKVHVAAEMLATGRAVVGGVVTGPLVRVDDGDLSGIPDGAILAVPRTFDSEFADGLDRIGGIVDGHEGVTGYAAILARELDVPMVSGLVPPPEVGDGTVVTLDAERGVLYEETRGADR